MSDLLVVENLHRSYGSLHALRGLSFRVQSGELFGLLGPNGAGKTTLLSLLTGLQTPTSGTITLFDKPFDRNDLAQRKLVGIAPQDLALYDDLTARENLRFFGELYGLSGRELTTRIEEVLAAVALTDRANDRVNAYSGGMKRRLNIGVAVMHRPKLLLLDEPTVGVDPQSRNHIFEQVKALSAAGMTIVYTSHYMEEVQALCPRIGIMDHGRMIACDTLPNLLGLLESTITLTFADRPNLELLTRLPNVRIAEQIDHRVVLACQDVPNTTARLVDALRDGPTLVSVTSDIPNLERVFLHLTHSNLRDGI